jgi:osmotically inducible protein OsmC
MPDIIRQASGTWSGSLQNGTGTASTQSGALADARVSFPSRFEEPITGSNPEELIAAAHASCFSMALAGVLGRQGHTPQEIRTRATLTLNKGDSGFKITRLHLETEGNVPGLDVTAFKQAAESAKDNCPVSVLLKPGLEQLTVEAKLVG